MEGTDKSRLRDHSCGKCLKTGVAMLNVLRECQTFSYWSLVNGPSEDPYVDTSLCPTGHCELKVYFFYEKIVFIRGTLQTL